MRYWIRNVGSKEEAQDVVLLLRTAGSSLSKPVEITGGIYDPDKKILQLEGSVEDCVRKRFLDDSRKIGKNYQIEIVG